MILAIFREWWRTRVARTLDRVLLVLFGVFLAAWSVAMCLHAWNLYCEGRSSLAWIPVKAVVEAREAGGRGPAWMQLRYKVGGQEYTGVVEGFTPLHETTAFYDPQDPSQVAPERGVQWLYIVLLLLLPTGLVLTLVGKVALWWFPRLASVDHEFEEG